MVLESLMNPKTAERRPWEMILIGLLFASISIFLGLWIFKDQISLVMVFLTVIVSVPLMYLTIKYEEQKDLKIKKEIILLKEHGRALSFFICLFIGFVLAFSLWYIFLPETMVSSVFSTQIQTIKAINSRVIGTAHLTSFHSASSIFMQIFSNNIKVMLFCIFFSFFFGAGAIFILTWNASVISAAIGNFFRTNISEYAGAIGFTKIASYFHIFSLSILRYFIHGLPEIAAYFAAGLAGGIISVAVIKHDFGTKSFRKILFDSLDLIILSIALIVIAAFLEVFITPLFF